MPDFQWDRTPDPAWQEALDAAFPRAGNGSGLVVSWQPGGREAPVQRWVVVQMLPLAQCYAEDYAEGRQLPIPVMAHYLREMARHRGQDRPAWLQRIHEVVERAQCLPVPLWLVQGPDGGHPVTYGTVDRIWEQYRTGRTEPPAPGTLPYADFDSRVVAALVERDRWRGRWHDALAEAEGREADAERTIRRLMDERLQESTAEVVDRVSREFVENLPRGGPARDYQGEIDQYIETGEIASRAMSVTAP